MSTRQLTFAVVIWLLLLDICIPPAALPDSVQADTFGSNTVLVCIWALPQAVQARKKTHPTASVTTVTCACAYAYACACSCICLCLRLCMCVDALLI